MSLTLRLRPPERHIFARFRDASLSRLQRGMAKATAEAAEDARREMQGAMQATGLGRLGRALRGGSDHRLGRVGRGDGRALFRTSGWVVVRGGERAEGAVAAYSEGAQIVPRKGRWLAYATDAIPKRSGRYRMTPARYVAAGLDQRIGPLKFIPGERPGRAYLIAEGPLTIGDPGTHRGKARRLPKSGRTTRAKREFVIAFILVRATRRSARLDPERIAAAAATRVPALLAKHMASST